MILLDPFGCGAGVCVAGGTRPASSPGLSISALSLAHINTRQNLQTSQSQKLQIKKIKNKYPTFATKKQKKAFRYTHMKQFYEMFFAVSKGV